MQAILLPLSLYYHWICNLFWSLFTFYVPCPIMFSCLFLIFLITPHHILPHSIYPGKFCGINGFLVVAVGTDWGSACRCDRWWGWDVVLFSYWSNGGEWDGRSLDTTSDDGRFSWPLAAQRGLTGGQYSYLLVPVMAAVAVRKKVVSIGLFSPSCCL